MEENKSLIQPTSKPSEHTLTLVDRKHLTITGIDKVVSVKPDLLQVKSSAGDIVVTGQNFEVTKLDLEQHTLSLNGNFDTIKYSNNQKTPLLKKIFK